MISDFGALVTQPFNPFLRRLIFGVSSVKLQKLLGEECAAAGRAAHFEELKASLWGESRDDTQAEIAGRLGMSEGAFKVASHRMRARYRELLRAEIAHTVASPAEVDEELRHLIRVMSG